MRLYNSPDNQLYLIIPIETKAREFHAKTLLSCFAAEAGFNVILGDQNEIHQHLRYLPRGIYIDKSIASTKIKSFKKTRNMGNRVVAWCEEGLTFRDRDTYLKERISIESFKLVDIFFSWGEVQADAIKMKVGKGNDKIISTGNPRFDLLRHPYREIFSHEAEILRERYGRFILINSNFSRYNHFYGRDFVIKNLKEKGRIETRDEEAFFVKWADFLGEMYHHFIKMTRYLSELFPDYTIILRPHPSENQETWKEQTKDLRNVRIIYEGNVIPWILASRVMIHNSCTTGVEAFILDAPVICYAPITSETFDSELPNAICRKAYNEPDLADLLEKALADPSGFVLHDHEDLAVKSLVEEYIKGLYGPTACENIISALRDLAVMYPWTGSRSHQMPLGGVGMKVQSFIYSVKPVLRRIIKGPTGGSGYLKQKFPGLSIEEARQSIDIFRELTGRFTSVEVQAVPSTSSCFLISRGK
ncbi:MAG: hypothetical protein JW882_02435 [Deltaproteobacteria bacterium]|nr:hypothetical protein [Deltaproteobacteria bacterium]